MSVRYIISGRSGGEDWPVSSACLEGVSRLAQAGFAQQLADVGLGENSELGEELDLDRTKASAALAHLIPEARRVPKGFQVRFKSPHFGDADDGEPCRGASGFLIDGVHYAVFCEEDYWEVQPMIDPPVPPGKTVPPGMRGEPRREPAEIPTANYGVVKVEAIKGRSDVEVLLSRLRKFLAASADTTFRVVVG